MNLDVNTMIGLLTIIVSSIGVYITSKHASFFRKTDNGLGKSLKYIFTSDALIYIITLLFGVWALFDLGFAIALSLHVIRIPLLILNIMASLHILKVYRDIVKMGKRVNENG